MTDLLINSTTYTGIDSISIPTASNGMSRFKIDAEIKSGGTLLEYLDTTGSGCVNLGMGFTYPKATGCGFYMKFGVLDASSTQVICGTGTTGSNIVDQLAFVTGKVRTDRVNGSTNRFIISVGNVIEYSFGGGASGNGLFVVDKTSSNAFGGADNAVMYNITPAHNMVLFSEYTGSAYSTFATVRFYEMLYTEGGVEIMHLFPALDSNNVKCLYDTVSKNYFYSENGAFE